MKMLKWIRWPGLIAFAVVIGGVFAFFLLAAAPLAKSAIETFGTMVNGAKVEVKSVGLSFAPLGIRIQGLQVADEQAPMTNALAFDSAVAELELAPLFAGRGIIKELSIQGLVFGSERTTSGFVAKKEAPKKEAEEPSKIKEALDSVELPDPKEILAKETLKTEVLGEEFKHSLEKNKAELNQRLAAVPDEAALKKYEDDLKKITSGDIKSLEDFTQRKKQLDELKQSFKADQQAVEAARKAIRDSKTTMAAQLKGLKDAPSEDLKNIKEKYSLDAAGATNLTAMLFGDEAGEWASKTLYWYEKIKPYLASDDSAQDEVGKVEKPAPSARNGRLIHFPTNDPWPSFLVRKAHASAALDWGNLQIDAEDITHQPKVLGRPARLAAQGKNLSAMDALKLNVVLDHRQSPGIDTLKLNIDNWRPDAMKLGVAGIQLADAVTQVQASATVSGNQLEATGGASFAQVNFSGNSSNTFERELTAALSGIKQFAVNGEAKGRLTSPKVGISSDLDKQLSHAFNQRINEKQKEFEEQLKQEINAKLDGYLGEYSDVLAQFNSAEGGLDAKLDKLKTLGKSELADYGSQQKSKAKDKIKGLF